MPAAGKVVVITGAKGGLGEAVTPAFLDAGATVIGVSRSIATSDFPRERFTALAAELSTTEAAQTVIETVAAEFGRIDVLVHLVGAFSGGVPVAATGDASFERMLELNLWSAFRVVRAVLPHMRAREAGSILAVGSRSAVEPAANAGAYAASKAALVSLIRTVASENRDCGITANIVLPGTMDTPANRAANPSADLAAWVQPAQVASLLVYLAGQSEVNGAAIPVYGREV